MAKPKLVKKGIRVFKEEGVGQFSRKLAQFSLNKAQFYALRVLPIKLQSRIDVVNEEFTFVSNPVFQINSADLKKSQAATSATKPEVIKTATWFVPYFDHLNYGGISTIFRFINYLAQQGVRSRVVIYDNPEVDLEELDKEIKRAFPTIKNLDLEALSPKQKVDKLPPTDIAFCTFWVSAYFLLKFNQTKRKYYFIQDYEPLFYAAGATYALAESTYRFGFKGIVNTPGLLAAVNKRHGMEGISFVPAVDRTIYYPPASKRENKKIRIFFYARPQNPRNAFSLGVQIIKQLKLKYRDQIEVVTAGANWKERRYGLWNVVRNEGLIKTLPEVAGLYRTCDIGFVYMLSKHPSYQPFEFMATGVATVTNNNEDNLWFLRHEENCLLAEPSAKAMVEQISRLIEDEQLRSRIAENGLKTVENDWDWQTQVIWNDIQKSKD